MSPFVPLLALPGIFFGFLIWSRLARTIGAIVMSSGRQPVSDADTIRRLKWVFFCLAIPWLIGLGAAADALYSRPAAQSGWFWFVLGAAVVPFIVAVTFGRVVRKMSVVRPPSRQENP